MIKIRWTLVLPVIMSTEPKLFAAWLKKNLGAKVVRGKRMGEVIYFVTFRANETYVLVETKALNTRAGVLTISLFRNSMAAFEKLFPLPSKKLFPVPKDISVSTEEGGEDLQGLEWWQNKEAHRLHPREYSWELTKPRSLKWRLSSCLAFFIT